MRLKRVIAGLLVGAMSFSMIGCGAKRSESIDKNKTTVYVGNFLGGVGDEWLKDAIEKFEEKFATTSFEEGKKGVQLIISENNRTTTGGTELLDLMKSSKTDIYFTESVPYYDLINKGLLADVSDMANETLTEYGEDRSILDKLNADFKETLMVDGKIYAIPFWEGFYGLVYNATLFDENKWYFAEGGGFTDASGKLAAGPDGKTGTYDDGLPATYDDFFLVMDEMVKDNVTPLQWGSSDYFNWFLGALAADYEGYDGTWLNYTMDGEAELVKFDTVSADGTSYETEKVAITKQNGYELARQAGFLQSLNFAQRLLQGKDYFDPNISLSPAYKVSDAQLAFIRNAFTTNAKPVAMIIDGSWWENESTSAFEETYGTNATKYDNEMEMKWMPLPKANAEKVGSPNVQISPLNSFCLINANASGAKLDVAKAFVQFCHTDEMMAEFTSITGMYKPYDYKLKDEKSTVCVESVKEIKESCRVIYPTSNNELVQYAYNNFMLAALYNSIYDSNESYSSGIPNILTKKEHIDGYAYDAMDIFKGMYTYRKNNLWSTFGNILK